MEKLREIKELQGFLHFLKENKAKLQKAALPVVVIIALVVFWFFGGEEEIEVPDGNSAGGTQVVTEEGSETEGGGTYTSDIYVDIGGEVENPGVYQVKEGTRLFQVIEKAGGLKEQADTDSINQAETVMDGQKIIIGSLDEASPYFTGSDTSSSVTGSNSNGSNTGSSVTSFNPGSGSAVRETENGTVVNINRASLEQLQLIPGVGPSTAQKIVDYRETNGAFNAIEELKNISGIGDKTFEKMKEYIEV